MDKNAQEEKLFAVLMSEKEQADQQIRSFLDLQSKLTGVMLPALAATVGWLIVERKVPLSPEGKGIALLTVATLLEFGMIYGVFSYGVALGSMTYKHRFLNEQFELILGRRPLGAVSAFKDSAARGPINFTAAIFNVLQLTAVGIILYFVGVSAWGKPGFPSLRPWVIGSGLLFVAAVCAQWVLFKAVKDVFGGPSHGGSAHGQESDTV
jgi:hypothetical protein